ncbi:MAG: HigA family addiction module antitoxin [Muribaculaceae bacterium]
METNSNRHSVQSTHPGTILRYELQERGISQREFAAVIGMRPSHLNDLIKGRRSLTNAIADKIEQALGISSVALVNMQTQYNYDLRHREVQSQTQPSGIIRLCTNVLGIPSTATHPG